MEEQKRIPQLRFPDFKEEWKQKKFGTVTERITDIVDVELDTMYQQIGIRSHGKGIFHKELVDGKTLGDKRVFWVKENVLIVNIVFAWEQAIAKTTENEIGMIASHRFPMYLPINSQSDLNYLLYFFLTKKGKSLLELASPGGAGRNKTLGQKEFEKLTFTIPEVSEQKKIASFLLTIDEKLQVLKRKKALLEQYKKGVMQKIFSQELRFKDDDGGEFPEWEESKIGLNGKFIGGGTPDTKNDDFWKGTIPWISSSDLTDDNIFCIEKTRFITKEAIGSSATKIVPCNSVLIVSRVGVGKVAITDSEVCTSQDFCNLIVDRGSSVFFAYLIKFKTNKLLAFNQGTSIKGFVKKDLEDLDILLPCKKEQTKIATFLSTIDKKIGHTKMQIEKTEVWKKGLLQQMFC